MNLQTELCNRIAAFDLQKLKDEYQLQNELLVIENFLPKTILDKLLLVLPSLQSVVHRNYIPRHKKGASISRFDLDRLAPIFREVYQLPILHKFLMKITAEDLLLCPNSDSHTYALYYYTEPGDHIQYHYDTSYYQGKRYTVLIGLVDRSSSQLEYQLYRDELERETQMRSLILAFAQCLVIKVHR